MRSSAVVGALLLLMLASERAAQATPAGKDEAAALKEAAELYRQGRAAFERGDYRIAGVAFDAADNALPRAQTALSAGLSWQAAGDEPRAADDFAHALALGGLSSDEETSARQHLAELEAKLGRVALSAPASGARISASIAHVDKRALPFEVHVAPGSYVIAYQTPNGDRQARVTVTVGARVEIPAPEDGAAKAKAPTSSAPPDGLNDAPQTGSSRRGVQRGLAFGAFALAGGGAIATAALGAMTLQKRSAYEATGFTDRSLYNEGTTLRTSTNVALGAAAGFAILGTVLLLTLPAKPRARAMLDGRGLGLRFP